TTISTRGLTNERDTHPFLNKTINNIVIFIDFPDASFGSSLDAEYFDEILNTNDNSLKNWFETASYGKTSVVSHLYPTPNGTILGAYRDDYPRSTYQVHHQDSNGNDVYMLEGEVITREELEQSLLERAINAVSSQISEEISIDVDEDDCVDSVTFVIAGDNEAWSRLLWSHKSSLSKEAYLNGKKVKNYIFVMEEEIKPGKRADTIFQHELFHLYGAPDLYHYSTHNPYIGIQRWDIMNDSKGQMPCMYMKYKYGNWIDEIPEIKSDTQGCTINKSTLPTNNCYVLRSPYSLNEFFVVEYRKKEEPFEDTISGDGVVIYRIDSRFKGNASYNGTTVLNEVFVSETPQADSARYPYWSNEVELTLHDGTNAGIKLSNFILSGDTASFDVEFSYNELLNRFMDKKIIYTIGKTLNIPIEEITEEDLQTITSLLLDSTNSYDFSLDLTGLEQLSNLQNLTLNNCIVEDLPTIGNLTKLKHLELANNEIEDINPIGKLTNLTYLGLANNKIEDISPIGNLTNLTHIELTNNEIEDISPIGKLTNLTYLGLANNKTEDISPIGNLINLTHLELTDNNIQDFSPLEGLTSLTYLKIRGNISGDYSATEEYYDTLIEKDFSLNNQNDVVFSIQEYNNQHNIGDVHILSSDTVPEKIHIIIEKYAANGTLILQSRCENVGNLEYSPIFYIPPEFNCQDGAYVVISAYERQDFTKLISKCTVEPVIFDFANFN
ncbi:MAG: M6 family metalloprotease domain-containing protein, partial [Clostridia bacterium]|nr:M6 family metalloprotease domain-containing protein [Clostridia bacterium]